MPADGSPARVTVTLPGVVAPIEAGNRLMVSVGTTDQGYAGTTDPGGLADRARRRRGAALVVPVVPGEAVTANTVPLGPLLGIAGVLAAALLAMVAARLRRRRAAARPGGADACRRPRRADVRRRGRWRSATSPRPTAAGSARCAGVSFDVERGMVLGLLGPNGAGKTTVLRMLMGLIRPTAGTIRAFGEPVGAGAPVLARIGAFVEGPGFLPHLSGLENLRLYWAATGRPDRGGAPRRGAGDRRARRARCDRRVGTYSQGMRQRLAIAQAMLGLPELLVLDEPTNGLDPPQIHAMREVLQRYAAAGRTVLVSSHLLAEVEQTCSHVVVMHQGKVVASGHGRRDHRRAAARRASRVDAPERAAAVLGGLDGVRGVARRRRRRARRARTAPPRSAAVRALVAAGVEVRSAGPRRRLEDAFLQLVGEDRTPMTARRTQASAGRRSRRDAAHGPSTVAGHVGALPLVEHAPYRPERTLPVRVELVRQLRRRRTQVAFALVALLPVILWIAFELGDDGPPGGAPNLVDLAKGSGGELRGVRAVRLGVVPAGRGRGAVLRRHGGGRGVVVEPALPARRADPAGPAAAAEGGRRRRCCRSPRCSCCRSWRCWWARSPTGRTTW